MSCSSYQDPGNDTAVIVPVGDVEPGLLEELRKALGEKFFMPFSIGRPMDIPEEAYDPGRGQYHSPTILNILRHEREGKKVLGVIDRDLYVPELNFVFGEAELRGRVALISVTRLRQGFYGLPEDDAIFFERVLKEAVHELGHTCGFGHCKDPGCVMFFSNSLADTDRKGSSFCARCRRKISGRS